MIQVAGMEFSGYLTIEEAQKADDDATRGIGPLSTF
jgi:hypothetical protein